MGYNKKKIRLKIKQLPLLFKWMISVGEGTPLFHSFYCSVKFSALFITSFKKVGKQKRTLADVPCPLDLC